MKIRMLQEAQRLHLCTNDGNPVNTWRKLREFYATHTSKEGKKAMYACAIGVFESSPGWVQDQTSKILKEMGWEYDPESMVSKSKKLGNGCVEKMISRKKSNLRKSLRKCCLDGPMKYKLRIVRPKEEMYDEKGSYIRRKAGYLSEDGEDDDSASHDSHINDENPKEAEVQEVTVVSVIMTLTGNEFSNVYHTFFLCNSEHTFQVD